MYTPLTQQQFNNAQKAGFSPQQITQMELTRKAEQGGTTAQPTATPPAKPGGLLGAAQGIGNFLGISKLGQGLASSIRVGSGEVNKDIQTQNESGANAAKLIAAAKLQPDPTKRTRLLNLAKQMGSAPSAGEIDPGLNLSNKEIIGSAANVGLNILGGGELSGVAKAGGFTSRLAPEFVSAASKSLKAAKPLLEGGGLAGKIGRNATLGGGFGLAQGLNDNKSGTDLAGSAITGGVLGGALPAIGAAASKAKNFATQTLPEQLFNNAIKPTLDELKKSVKYGSDTLGKDLLKQGVYGSPNKLLTLAKSTLNTTEDQLQKVLSKSTATIKRSEIAPFLSRLEEKSKATPGMADEVLKVKKVLMGLPREISVSEANQIKRNLYEVVNDAGYKLDASLATKRSAQKEMAKGLKTLIEEKTKSTSGNKVQILNKKLATYGRLQDRAVDVLAKEAKKSGVSFVDLLLGSGGGILGHPIAGLGLVAAKHVAGSPTAKTTAAHYLYKAGQKLPAVPAALGRLTKQAVLDQSSKVQAGMFGN